MAANSEGQNGATPALGPIIRWRGEANGEAVLEVTVTGLTPAPLEADPPLAAVNGGAFEPIGSLAGTAFWSAGLTAPAHVSGRVRYRVHGIEHTFVLPGAGETVRLAFASCNGAEDQDALDKTPHGPTALWTRLGNQHAANPFHLLTLGGDQIYADGLWDLPSIREWAALPKRTRYAAPFTDTMKGELEAHYLELYQSAFGDPAVADVIAQIPSVMIWDDHDIVDGWGSRPATWQASPVAAGLFEVARRAFCLVQLGVDPERDAGPYGRDSVCGCVRLIVPDLRSERTRRRAMGPVEHGRLASLVEATREAHAIVVASVPLVNADLSLLERLVAPFQPLFDFYQDDLRDQWMSYGHRREWASVMDALFALARRQPRVSVLSGEIHLGAYATAVKDGARIEQFIASGIAHPAPPKAFAKGYGLFAALTGNRAGISVDVHPIFPGGRRYVADRNWLEVTAEPDGALRATLHPENSDAIVLSEV